MAKNDFPKTSPAESYPLGNAKENKDASAYTGFKYPAGGGDDIGVYKQPMPNPNGDMRDAVVNTKNQMDELRISVAGVSKSSVGSTVNKNGEKVMRGYGAATKGIKTRGPMA